MSKLDGIDDLKKDIEEIKSNLGDTDLASVNADLEKVKEDLEKLLSQQSFIQGPINIRNQAELKYVKTLGEIKNVRGSVTVDISSESMHDSIAAVNDVVSKINTIIAGDLTTTGHASDVLDFSALTFVDGNLTVKTKANSMEGLTAVTKDLNLDYPSDYVFPNLASTGSITIKDSDKVLKVDFPSLLTNDSGGTFQTGATPSVVSLAKATHVDLGGVQVRSITAPEAVTVKLGFSGTLAGTTTITAAKATEITLGATKIGAHALTIAGKSDGTVNLNALKEIGAGASVSGAAVNLDALKTATGTLVLDGSKTLNLPALEKADGISAAAATTFSAEKLVLSATATLSAATEITLASTSADLLATKDKVVTLTITALANAVNFDASAFSVLETLSVTGKTPKEADVSEGSQTNQVTADNAAKLKTISLAGAIKDISLENNTSLENLTTAGNIVDVFIRNNDKLKTIKFEHSFLKGELASTLRVEDNAELTEVDMATVQKIKGINIADNPKLASIKVGAPDVLAEPSATVTITVLSNKLPGKYTNAKAGSETSEYTAPVIVQADLYALKLIIDAYNSQKSRTLSVTFNLGFDKALNDKGEETDVTLADKLDADTAAHNGEDGESTATATDDVNKDNDSNNSVNGGGVDQGIDTARELALLKKE
ncbi:MAG: hypothetical protein VW127_04385 [Flavobacteriaceae bacterium]